MKQKFKQQVQAANPRPPRGPPRLDASASAMEDGLKKGDDAKQAKRSEQTEDRRSEEETSKTKKRKERSEEGDDENEKKRR